MPKQPEASLMRDPATDYLPLRQGGSKRSFPGEWNVEHGGPLELRPLASDTFTERHERAARKAEKQCHCVFSENAPMPVGLLFR
jgi:hypothetical protein